MKPLVEDSPSIGHPLYKGYFSRSQMLLMHFLLLKKDSLSIVVFTLGF